MAWTTIPSVYTDQNASQRERTPIEEHGTNLSGTAGDRAFTNYAPRAWNQLPEAVKLTHSVAAFRGSLNIFLLETLYYQLL